MTTTMTATATPILLTATPSPGPGGTTIDLVFNTAMAAGSGTITITDGAVQTVIDRATGQPAMRVVGATDTHTVSAASVSVDGTHVTLNVAGLLPGHQYSIVMGSGVLLSSDHVAFGGVRSTSAFQFITAVADSTGLSAAIALDGAELKYGDEIGVTITLNSRVSQADLAGALAAQNGHIDIESLVTTDDGLTWKASLASSGNALDDSNVVTLDLSKLHGADGKAGSGIVASANYKVDNIVATHIGPDIGINDYYGPSEDDHVSNDASQSISFTLSAPLGAGEKIEISIDGHAVDAAQLKKVIENDPTYWYLSSEDTNFADGEHTFSARVVDAAGHGSATITQQFTIDTVGPKMLSSPDGATGVVAGDALSFTFDEAMYPITGEGYSVITFTDPDGHVTRVDIYESNLSPDRKTLTIPAGQHHLQTGTDYTVTLPGDLTDLAGNSVQNREPIHFRTAGTDTLAPAANSAVAQVYKGIYGIGARIDIEVGFSEAVKVAGSGAPTLLLSNGDLAVFDHLSEDQHTMVFTYTVPARSASASGDLDVGDGTGLVGHVSDLAGNLLDAAHIHYSFLQNLSPSGDGGPIQIDAEASPAPGTPTLLAGSDTGTQGDGITSVSTPSLTGSGTASFATVKLYEGDVLLASTHSDTDGKWTITADDWVGGQHLGDGAHTLVVRQYDSANNASAASAALTISVDTVAPGKPGAPVLDAASDTGILNNDGITSIKTPTIKGTALEADGTVELYEGDTLIGTAAVQADKSWSFTIGSQSDRLAQFADGTHDLTVRQVDAAGNRGVVSDALSVTVDTVAPTLQASEFEWNSDKHRFELNFNEKIVFAAGHHVDVFTGLGVFQSRFLESGHSDWTIAADDHGVQSVLELNLGGLIGLLGHFDVQADTGAIQDVAGNVAVIGMPTGFDIPLITS
jgi:hypothetical protein